MKIVLNAFILITTFAQSQSIRGTVFDQQTQVPLPYANLGVKGRTVGGITDGSGNFSIEIAQAAPSDSLIVSYLGYKSQRFLISSLSTNSPIAIYLIPAPQLLNEVVVLAKQETLIFGNKNKSHMHSGWGDFSSSRGRAFGLLIPAPEAPVKVNKVVFHLHENEFDSIRLRINIFRTDRKTVLPSYGQTQNIFITVRQRKGWIEVPIPETIILREDVVVAIEWVDAWGAKVRSLREGGSYIFTLSLGHHGGFQYRREKPEQPLELSQADLCPSIYIECFAAKR